MKQDQPSALRPTASVAQAPTAQAAAAEPPPAAMAAQAQESPYEPPPPSGEPASSVALTWALGGLALLTSVGWIMERRQRRLLEMEKDSVLWADVQPAGSDITTVGRLDEILADSPDPEQSARGVYVHHGREAHSRREATLIDLHELHGKLWRRRGRGDNAAAVLLLQQHLADFRYTSPWVFLELHELCKLLDRRTEWEAARDAFRERFGQEAPDWSAPSTADSQLLENPRLHEKVSRHWPTREARLFILHSLLGDAEMRQQGTGPALLALGVYRDLMLLDQVLGQIVSLRPTHTPDSLF